MNAESSSGPSLQHAQVPPPRSDDAPRSATHSAFVPVLLGLAAVFVWLGFQTLQLIDSREALQAARSGQQAAVDSAAKLRASLDTVAADTQRLADSGNTNARTLVAELGRRGITINPAGAAPPAAPVLPASR